MPTPEIIELTRTPATAPVTVTVTATDPAPRSDVRAPHTTSPAAALSRLGIEHWIKPVIAVLILAALVLLPQTLPAQGRAALFAFGVAVVLWSMTTLPVAWVALAAVVVLVLLGGAAQDALFESLASDVVWLMIGAFVLGGAVQATGLAGRITALAGRGQTPITSIFLRVTLLLIPLSLVIPSTSGRAAVMVPVYRALAGAAGSRQVSRALALLIPSVILVSTISTLVGAGSHLIANDLLASATGERIGFLQWMAYGVPFGLAASLTTCAAILFMFLPAAARTRTIALPERRGTPLRPAERTTLIILAAMVALWASEAVHGIEIAFVAALGAIALTMPGLGVLRWKAAMKSVSWNLVVFVGAALVLGEALIDSGAAGWIVERLFALSGIADSRSEFVVIAVLALLTLTSHLYMTSHAARAAALVPAVLYLAESLDLNAAAVLFICTVGMDYCLTFPVSSKALLLFGELDEDTFDPPDLLRLSAVLFVAHVALMVACYFGYWRFVGLAL